MNALDVAKFWMKVDGGSTFQCWNWLGAKNPKGYGRMAGHRAMAHRTAYELVVGPIPAGQVLRHSCDNPACCNPKHLSPGTHQDNMSDMVRRRRSSAGELNGNTKLSEEGARYIKRNPDGLTITALAEKFGVGKVTVSYIRNGRSWKYLK